MLQSQLSTVSNLSKKKKKPLNCVLVVVVFETDKAMCFGCQNVQRNRFHAGPLYCQTHLTGVHFFFFFFDMPLSTHLLLMFRICFLFLFFLMEVKWQ